MTNLLRSKQISLEFQSDPKKFKKYHKIKYISAKPETSVKLQGLCITLQKHSNLTSKHLVTILKIIKPELKFFYRGRAQLLLKVDTILTQKPKDIRMGRGKGAPSEKVFSLKAGKNLLTLYGLRCISAENIGNLCLPKLHKSYKINRQKW